MAVLSSPFAWLEICAAISENWEFQEFVNAAVDEGAAEAYVPLERLSNNKPKIAIEAGRHFSVVIAPPVKSCIPVLYLFI
jgi:hypothetical protein